MVKKTNLKRKKMTVKEAVFKALEARKETFTYLDVYKHILEQVFPLLSKDPD